MNYNEYMKNFDAVKVKNDIVQWIRNWFAQNGRGCTAVIGISGGKDSSVVAALCVEALGYENVLGVLMPKGEQTDIADAWKVINHLRIKGIEANIEGAVNAVLGSTDVLWSIRTKVNLPARIRMATLYAISQSWQGRVSNNCNLSEDWVGYSTWFGDSAGDFSPLSRLTTDEVVAVGKACGLPTELMEKTPSDGLCGKSDEDNLGFSYRALNEYIRTGRCEDAKIKARIDELHEKNLFKLQPMPAFEYTPYPDSLS